MPWCPKCGTEYVKGIKECADCGVPLADEPGGKKGAKPGKEGKTKEVFLCNLSGPVELTYIESIFEEEGIPYRAEDSDMGLYLQSLMGSSFFGKDIYVSESDFERASKIMESFKADIVTEDMPEEAEEDYN